jgi:hypothetical protein
MKPNRRSICSIRLQRRRILIAWAVALLVIAVSILRPALTAQTAQQLQQQREQQQREEQQWEEQQREEQQREEQQREQQQREEQQRQEQQQEQQQRQEQQRQQQEVQQREEQQRQREQEQQRQQQIQEQQRQRPAEPALTTRPVNPEPIRPPQLTNVPERSVLSAGPQQGERRLPIVLPPDHAPLPHALDHPPVIGPPDRQPVMHPPVHPPVIRPPDHLPARPDDPKSVDHPLPVFLRPVAHPVITVHPVRPIVAVRPPVLVALPPPRPRPVIVSSPVAVVRPPLVTVVAAPSPARVMIALPGVSRPSAAVIEPSSVAQLQVAQAEASCAQAGAYQNYVNQLTNQQNTTSDGINQILQALASNTTDPNLQNALLNSMNQPDLINSALDQQLQNQANSFEVTCQTQLAAAQEQMAAAQAAQPQAPLTAVSGTPAQPANPAGSGGVQQGAFNQPGLAAAVPPAVTGPLAQAATQQPATAAAKNGGKQPPANSENGSSLPLKVTWGSAPILKQVYVSFAFSTPSAFDPNFGGDGAWGAALSADEQTSINQSGAGCMANS